MQAVAHLAHCKGEDEKSSFAAAAAKLDAIEVPEVPSPESCGSAAVCPPSSTNLDVVLSCSQPRYSSADNGSCACTSSEHETVLSEGVQGSGRASGQKGICYQHGSNQGDLSETASGEARHVEHPWDELVDSDSQSLPHSPAACSSFSSGAVSRSPSVSAPHSVLTWAVQQQPHEAAADQSMPGSRQTSPGQANVLFIAKLQLPSLPSNESQPGTDSHGAESLPNFERPRHVHWQLQQHVTGAQQQTVCPGQSKHAQHSLATPRMGLKEDLGGSNQGTTRVAAGKGRGSKHLLMSSLDMDAYFGNVANDSHPQAARAGHMTGQPHMSVLLHHSESFEQLSQSIPDPFAEGYTHAKHDRVSAKSGWTPPKVRRVQSKSGKGLAKSGQTLSTPDSNQVSSSREISKSDQTHAKISTSSGHPVMREVAKVAQGSWNSDIAVLSAAPQYVRGSDSRGQLYNTAWQSGLAGAVTASASAPNSPLPVKQATGKKSHRATFAGSQQLGVLHHKALQQPFGIIAQQVQSLSECQALPSGNDSQLGGHSPQDLGWQWEKEEQQSPPEAEQRFQHDSKLGSHPVSKWQQQQQEEEQQMPVEVQQGCQSESQLGSQGQQQEGEDPFKASAMFPVYAELAGSRPLTDCTNQLASTGIQSHQHGYMPHTVAQSRQSRHASKSAADVNKAANSVLALHQASAKSAYSGQQACGPTSAVEPMPAQRLTCSAPDAAAVLTSLSEADFWQAARADLTDTAETVKHRSRLCYSLLMASTPVKVHQMKAFGGSMAQTPKLAMHQAHDSGITPLLDHGGGIKPCRHQMDIEDEDDPMKADWGL
ncbi:MAG: hypothetical protein FRX49_05865 [Trebouxia sp. A1-2]|nr:MAG: hypothetical protein FRX49_05865 [Trebouxia sp. A1-2]